MMNKIADLMNRLEHLKLMREQESDPDPLSISLEEYLAEMAALNENGIAALAAETDEYGRQILTLEQAREYVEYCRGYVHVAN